jgi:long-chain acyl-CoA synthetase
MLKLPVEERTRFDLSSLEVAIHAAAPCPVPVKEEMIGWWGPIIDEYYGATEALGFTSCNSEEWLAHKGTGREGDPRRPAHPRRRHATGPGGGAGTIWFKTATEFEYHDDPEKTREVTSPDGTMTTVNDVGYVDEEGYLYLTDRKTFMIISGGVNVYPQETENLLITHPKVADAAVFGVPNPDLGEEVKAVVQPVAGVEPDERSRRSCSPSAGPTSPARRCRARSTSRRSSPAPTGKLYKRELRDRYWAEGTSRIV